MKKEKRETREYQKHSEELKLQAIRLYKKYGNFYTVSEKTGIKHHTIRRWITQMQDIQKRTYKKYPIEIRMEVIREVKSGNLTLIQAKDLYDIKSIATIRNWITRYEIHVPNKDMETDHIKTLKDALIKANHKINALETMIDIAESQLKVQIRKKHGAKQ